MESEHCEEFSSELSRERGVSLSSAGLAPLAEYWQRSQGRQLDTKQEAAAKALYQVKLLSCSCALLTDLMTVSTHCPFPCPLSLDKCRPVFRRLWRHC